MEPRAVEDRWRGLTSSQAAARLRKDGPNVLPTAPPPPAWRLLAGQMVHFFAVLLWVAGGLAFVARMPELGVAIFAVVIINGLFSFFQEYRAERAAERLRDLLPRRATVLRNGEPVEVDAGGLVVGDVVLLSAGDRISADLRVGVAHALSLDTSTLTGESVPESVGAGDDAPAGTFVVEGEGVATVTATGSATRLAGIARLTGESRRPKSPLTRELDRVVRSVALIALLVGTTFFVVALLVGTPASAGFLFAIGVTVALVPEGLLPTVTLSLAMGGQRMAARHALVRRLESVETLGSTTFICTDKTGTLTRNEMSVVEAWTPDGAARVSGRGYDPEGSVEAGEAAYPALRGMARAAARCSTGRAVREGDGWVARGDPMEAALDAFARRLGVDVAADERSALETRRFPFDPHRRRMSVVAGDKLLVKGAPDSVLPRCREADGAADALRKMARRGLRVMAVAARSADGIPGDAGGAESRLDLLGLVGLEDPPRAGAAESVAACRGAGIRVAMVTGDHPETARAIARETGLLGEGGLVVEGGELPRDEALLGALLDRDGVVVSRVAPEDKLRIARALQQRGHVVAMTGDGVNDGPALQQADIGVAMGRSGTDVAREAADLVLLDDDFATIVAAVEQGRATFENVRRFLTYHLTDNVAELTPFVFWALSGGSFPLALGVLQILALDIGTDLLPALALGAEPPRKDALKRPPGGRHLVDGALLRRVFGVLGAAEALVEMAAFVATFVAFGWRPGEGFPGGGVLLAASGAAFSAVVLGQMANAFACRSTTRWPGSLGWTTNRLLVGAVATELVALAGFLFVGPLASLLGHAPPPLWGWAVAALAVPAVLAADAAHKASRSGGGKKGANAPRGRAQSPGR
ncbi:HAD-IC family P-type ATPase [Rubrobacter tropicus]|uniref:HAD-IC family P-type ATPase n=1 Tax=Rubrobacter tropicus TaxID=2653851 RepID=A0A6G8QE41_9ACTN|nr:cation-transporting P-type ATPase [Rubrobacter tropicus]QIN84749.1 HAD-IC family P-type ATPase [Rubrobacter tropicus]